ncbi:hexameric tyrosine-coordinated heme protein [Streptomyces gilvus]|uniref:hexameric tyrosine-coordinated heme protein n=1 Tax=Streptomyces gilvus TaxID=2920937 RepID=UPI001F105CE4|nr:hexameric tyrosine-coordinated heme protein [Streptomyces sp. CME 23]MCH5676885.1 hexameric tyrosine-coordinated heme protein [Streptomyces sp. CME 23]
MSVEPHGEATKAVIVNRIPDEALVLVPGGTLKTATSEEGRAPAIAMVRNTVHMIQPDLDVLKAGRPEYAGDAEGLIAAAQVVTAEFATIAAANDYWR